MMNTIPDDSRTTVLLPMLSLPGAEGAWRVFLDRDMAVLGAIAFAASWEADAINTASLPPFVTDVRADTGDEHIVSAGAASDPVASDHSSHTRSAEGVRQAWDFDPDVQGAQRSLPAPHDLGVQSSANGPAISFAVGNGFHVDPAIQPGETVPIRVSLNLLAHLAMPELSGNANSSNSGFAAQEVSALLGTSLQVHLTTVADHTEEQLILASTTSSHIMGGSAPSADLGSGVLDSSSISPAVASSSPSLAGMTSTATPVAGGLEGGASAPANDGSLGAAAPNVPASTGLIASDPGLSASTPAATGSSVESPSSATPTLTSVVSAIVQFETSYPDFKIINLQNEVILYDPHLTPANVASATQESFVFHDGSTVVLIGLPSDIAGHHTLS